MFEKHAKASELDAALGGVTADALLQDAAVGSAGMGLREADLVALVEEAFGDVAKFTRYVQRLARLSMPGADL
eukprot:6056847-Prymnesium_polylepis.1